MTLAAPSVAPIDASLIKAALDRLDATAHELERRWGIGRLRLLVDDILRAKFDRQAKLLDEALWVTPGTTGDGNMILAQINAMERGWHALDRAAVTAGHHPKPPNWMEALGPNGELFLIVADNADASQIGQQARGRNATVFTAEEVARLLVAWPDIPRVKETFAGATVTEIRAKRPPDWEHGDDLPF